MTNINTFQGDVFIHEYIKHTGDDNNLFGFSGTDTFKIATAGADRLTVRQWGSVTVGVNLFIPDYIITAGIANTYFGFSADRYIHNSHSWDRSFDYQLVVNVILVRHLCIPDYIYHSRGYQHLLWVFW